MNSAISFVDRLLIIVLVVVGYKFRSIISEHQFWWLYVLACAIFLLSSVIKYEFFHFDSLKSKFIVYISKFFAYHAIWSLALDAFFTFSLAWFNASAFKGNNYIIVITSLISVPISRFYFTNRIILIVKGIVNLNFKFTVFRRFQKSDSIKSLLLPSIGAFGEIYTINDNLLEESDSNVNADSASILSEERKYAYSSHSDWKYNATQQINNTDIVIFYWECIPTDNMIWELNEALDRKKASELLFVVPTELKKEFEKDYLKYKTKNSKILVSDANFKSSFTRFLMENHINS